MSKFIIEKGIPMPKRAKHGELAETFAKMEVGDSFLHPQAKIQSALGSYGRRMGIKLQSKRVGDQLRIWRTA